MNSAALNFFQAGLFLVLILSAIFFGSVHAWASMPLAGILFLIIFLSPESVLSFQKIPVYFQIISIAVFFYLFFQVLKISINPWETCFELLKWTACGVLFLLVQRLPLASIEILLKLLILMAFAEAVYGLIQTRFGHSWILWRPQETFTGYATGTFLNRNQLAGFLELGMGVMMGYLAKNIHAGSRPNIAFILILFLTAFTALVQTGSRMGLFSFLTASFTGCGLLFLKKRSFPFIIFLFLLIGSAAALAIFLGQKEFASRLVDLHESWGGRPLAWQDTLKMIEKNFWLGTGLGTYAWSFPQYQSASLLMGWPHAHQDYLELAAGLGVPVFLAWSTGIGFFLLRILGKAWEQNDEFFLPVWGIGCGLFSFLLHGFTDFNWAVPSHCFYFFMLFSAALALTQTRKIDFNLTFPARILIRAACFFLILLTAQKAWAGVYSYGASRALKGKNYSVAAAKAEKSLQIDPGNSSTRFILGKSLYEEGRKNSNLLLLRQAEENFQRLTRERPAYGRAWIYLGLSSQDTDQMKRNFAEGLKWESSSAWNLYVTSARLLSHPEALSSGEKEHALEALAFSLSLHYKGQASPYLQSALRILWKSFKDFSILTRVTPQDYLSYEILLKFVEKKKLWSHLDQVSDEFLKLSRVEYEKQCARAWLLLSEGKTAESFALFEKNYWMRQELPEAKAGMLIAGTSFGAPLYDLKKSEKWLSELLEDEGMRLSAGRLQDLLPAIELIQNNYLHGLWAYRTAKYAEAIRSFEADAPSRIKTRRWRAKSYERTGQREKAVEILQPVLKEDNPDLRELLLLKTLDTESESESKIREIVTNYSSYALAPLKENKSSLWLNLMPGKTEIKIVLKSSPEKNIFSYVRFRLWENGTSEVVGGAYVSSSAWKLYRFDFVTSGGGRLLTIEQVNPGPQLEFGPLKIKTQK